MLLFIIFKASLCNLLEIFFNTQHTKKQQNSKSKNFIKKHLLLNFFKNFNTLQINTTPPSIKLQSISYYKQNICI